jgi:hypothetical protein
MTPENQSGSDHGSIKATQQPRRVSNTSYKLLPMVYEQKLAPGLDLQKDVPRAVGMGFGSGSPCGLPDKGTLTQNSEDRGLFAACAGSGSGRLVEPEVSEARAGRKATTGTNWIGMLRQDAGAREKSDSWRRRVWLAEGGVGP